MIRLAVLFILSYTLGHGHFANYRPQLLDKPLAEFHRTVNIVASDAAGFNDHTQSAFEPTRLLRALAFQGHS